MATIVNSYNLTPLLIGTGLIDFSADVFKVALLDGTYTFDAENHTVWTDASAMEISSVTYTNYSAGGQILANQTYTEVAGIGKFDADDAFWVGASITCRYGVVYIDATVDIYAKPLIAAILFDDTPLDVSREDFTILWSPSGVISLPKSA